MRLVMSSRHRAGFVQDPVLVKPFLLHLYFVLI